ncbi:circadian clock-controlled protein [Ooceraea biroi]|nr:circadian clock-controlled protein [Ooceraea biroi]
MSFSVLAVLSATAFVLAAADLELPVQTCKHDAPDYSSCLRLAMQEAWPNIIPGIPELDLPRLDPYFTKEQRNVYASGDIHADTTVTDVNTYGLAKTRFLAVRPEYSDDFLKLEIDVEIPKMLIEGNFKAEGGMGAFKLGGEGFFNISLEDIKGTWAIEGHVANDRWTIEHFLISPEIGKMQIWFSDLFNGNEELNKTALKFVNEYWPSLYRSVLPFMAEMWDAELTQISNRIFSKVSFSKTFP